MTISKILALHVTGLERITFLPTKLKFHINNKYYDHFMMISSHVTDKLHLFPHCVTFCAKSCTIVSQMMTKCMNYNLADISCRRVASYCVRTDLQYNKCYSVK